MNNAELEVGETMGFILVLSLANICEEILTYFGSNSKLFQDD